MKLSNVSPEFQGADILSQVTLPTRAGRVFSPALFPVLLLILIISFALRSYTISLDLPYFYNEDEAHHFNRVVEMVQRGEYNPHYFHKPSLHFYMRMPVIAASFLWTVKQGHIRSIQSIKTRDQHGLSGYSLTASHPGIVKWNRTLSVLFALGIVLCSGLIAFLLTERVTWAAIAALITGFSPGLIEYSAVIGVDMPTAFFCATTILFALLYHRTPSLATLLVTAILSGLAVSTKYNALPVALVPVLATVCSHPRSFLHFTLALIVPGISFFAGSPFILASLPLFLDHFAYEIWHYGQAAHTGQSANPGLEQVYYYGAWLRQDGIGLPYLIAALIGALLLFKNSFKAIITLSFPLLYFALMASQKTHFERNMLLIIGILPALSVFTFFKIQQLCSSFRTGSFLVLLCACIPVLLLGMQALSNRNLHLQESIDSRNKAFHWINSNTPPLFDTAVQGELQLPSFIVFQQGVSKLSVTGIKRIGAEELNPYELYQQGYSRIVVGPEFVLDSITKSFVTVEYTVPGEPVLDRIPKNPAIQILRFSEESLLNPEQIRPLIEAASISIPELSADCGSEEGRCWAATRISTLDESFAGDFFVFSPWGSQQIVFFDSSGDILKSFTIDTTPTLITIPEHSETRYLFVPEVHIPAHYSDSSDYRRLGVAFEQPKGTA